MTNFTQKEVDNIIVQHTKWLSNIQKSNARNNIYFINCNFNEKIFDNANLSLCYFRDCTFVYSSFRSVLAINAVFQNCVFTGADLSFADFRGSNLEGSCFIDTNFRHSNLEDADIKLCVFNKEEHIRKGIILDNPIIGYKVCFQSSKPPYPKIVTLEISKGAIVFSINNRKCRTNKAKVIDIENGGRVYSSKILYKDNEHNPAHYLSYYKGDEFNIKNFDMAYNVECSTGIHFFRTKEEAIEYFMS